MSAWPVVALRVPPVADQLNWSVSSFGSWATTWKVIGWPLVTLVGLAVKLWMSGFLPDGLEVTSTGLAPAVDAGVGGVAGKVTVQAVPVSRAARDRLIRW